MNLPRLLKHLFVPGWAGRRAFPAATLRKIEDAIRASEEQHDGELRFVAESAMPLHYLRGARPSRRRAEDLFAQLRVWDTEHNSGVLIYVQLLNRHIDIVADRGIAAKVPQAEWNAVCRAMEAEFRRGRYEAGALEGLSRITALLARHFPARGAHPNELPDKPLVL
ncbi:MAG TPA: TPM domain-containing protein [Burkholderiales bacterium]|nr:TPM domain-containing protein [Burkholderiales bacterium]